jgi:hypothetical protein
MVPRHLALPGQRDLSVWSELSGGNSGVAGRPMARTSGRTRENGGVYCGHRVIGALPYLLSAAGSTLAVEPGGIPH